MRVLLSPLPVEIEDLDIFEIVADQRGVVSALGAAHMGSDFDFESATADIAELIKHVDHGPNLGDLRDSLIDAATSSDVSVRPEQAATVVLSIASGDNGFRDAAVDSRDEL